MSIRKLLLLIAALLSLNSLIGSSLINVTIRSAAALRNTTDIPLDVINENTNATTITRLKNGTEYKFKMNSKIRTRSIVKRSKQRMYSQKKTDSRHRQLHVRVCPKTMVPLKNITKERLLGTWYAYATTPLTIQQYQRRCTSYNVRNNPYFNTNILYTDYSHLCITYSCLLNKKTGLYDIKLRVLTRTRIPMAKTLRTVSNFLIKIKFPIGNLDWLKTEAFCFEWYQLNFEIYPRPGRFQAPWNSDLDH